ncbi:LCP family protein [Streptomyces radicis]|uniref:LytR family transcriptional regulator n=1 Tax=Streptomyces radicis TaxID=1750517 RepID=A0A3A9WEB1_9ACTN|nr:LCP family protein [Streptomyces radicis]RKN11109.1 LytR family transcriptional regulator [Streptomyces radicis]RKN25429.1 LytR family transcriptional regulator [Streptomyces radicis]
MNDRQDPYGQVYGYDEYGRPLYGSVPPQAHEVPPQGQEQGHHQQPYPQGQDWQQGAGDPYGYDYGTGQQPPVTEGYAQGYQQYPGYADPQDYAAQGYPAQDYAPQGYPAPGYPVQDDTGQQRPVTADWGTGQQQPVAPEAPPVADVPPQRRGSGERGDGAPGAPGADGGDGGDGSGGGDDDHGTDEFAFVEERDEESEDVIDWLKFSESRTERREEARRRGRTKVKLLVILLVLALVGGVAFLWLTDRLPFLPGSDTAADGGPGAEVRDVIVLHLRPVDSDESSTALLIANETAGTGTTLLLPNELAVTPDGGTTTLGEAVNEEAAGSVRDAIGGLLGADIKGTWRLDTPYLENLVDLVGGITLTTDAEVAGGEDDEGPLVPRGEDVLLSGRAAVAYATHRADDEPSSAQLARFGQVMQAVMVTMPSGESGATRVVEALAQITDPSLTEDELAVSLAQLAGYAQEDAFDTVPLPVEADGTLSDETAEGLVVDMLGGTVSNADPGAAPRIGIRDASGAEAAEDARIALVNGGFTVVDARAADATETESRVTWADPAHQEVAVEVARTLGLPDEAAVEGEGAGNADVTIILGEDYGQ